MAPKIGLREPSICLQQVACIASSTAILSSLSSSYPNYFRCPQILHFKPSFALSPSALFLRRPSELLQLSIHLLPNQFSRQAQITAFSNHSAELKKLNTGLLGVSIDGVFSHLAWIQTDRKSGGLGDLKYPLASDVTKSISYGRQMVNLWLRSPSKFFSNSSSNIHPNLELYFISYSPRKRISLRGLFIIDEEGIIHQYTIDNLAIGRSVDETMRTLQALQYMQENSGGQLFSPSKHVETPTTMQLTLHPSLAITTATTNSLPGPNKFPSNTPNFPSLSCRRNLHFPSFSSTKTFISLPPKPPKPPEIPLSPPPNPLSNFQEEILYLDSIGIDYFALPSTHPSIVSVSAADLKSVVNFLRSTAGLTITDIRRIVAMCPEILTSKISSLIPVFTFLLREAGVDGSDLRHVIHRRPRLLVCSVEDRLRPTLYFLQSIGITSIKRHTSLLSCSVEQKFVPRIEYFRKIGFSQRDTMAMFRRFPPLFCYSIKDNFEPKFDFFVTEMKRELKELKEYPQYFSFSLENRIKPRHRRCVERSVSLALPVMLKTSEERFEGRLEMFCNSSIPVRTSPLWCATYEITAVSNHSAEVKKLNTGLLGVSIDGVFSHLAWIQTDSKSGGLGDLKYPLASDVAKSISKSYGELILDLALQYVQENSGGQLFSPSKHVQLPTPVQSTLHPSLPITTATTNSLPGPNNFPSNTPNFPSLSWRRNLHFPSSSSTKTFISLPPKPPKPAEIPSSPTPNPLSNFQEEILYLDSIGIDFFSLLSTHPSIVSVSAANLKSVVHFLRSTAGLTTTGIRRVVAMCPEVLTSKISSLIPVFTFLLREAGVDGSNLRHVIHRRPRLLVCSVESRLRPTLYFLQSIGVTSIKRHTSLLSCSVEQKFVPRIEYFQKIGFSQRDTLAIFRRFPPLFCYSIKDNLEPKFDFFVTEMRRELKELKEFPQYFSFSLENRIKPRHRRCVEKSASLALPVMLKTSEEKFEGRLEMICNSSMTVRTSPLWCATYDENVL